MYEIYWEKVKIVRTAPVDVAILFFFQILVQF